MTTLPYESAFNTALSARWNTVLDKLQNKLDLDVSIKSAGNKGVIAKNMATSFASTLVDQANPDIRKYFKTVGLDKTTRRDKLKDKKTKEPKTILTSVDGVVRPGCLSF